MNETQELAIGVNDINEGPVFSSSPNFTIDENTTIIGVAMATDPEGDSVGYTVSNTNIEIRSDGILSFINAPDFEQKSSYSETISATDGEISTDQPVTISVNNLNDNAPVFSSGSTFSADENQKTIGIIQATDADNDAIRYTISGPDSILMAIDEGSGALAFLDAPDYETRASYSLEINANDGGFTTTDTIVISINNLNDNFPIFSSSSSFTIDENMLNIGTVSASDADNDQLLYSISGEDASSINIDSQTGELIFKIAPDYETKSSYSLIIAVSDGLNTTISNLSILINNKNDNKPVFSSSSSFSVEENQLSVGSIKAEDADGDEVTFSIYGEDASYFQIDSNLGLLTFTAAPDYEQKSSFSIIVAADDGVNSTNQSLTINLIDICEFEIRNDTLDLSKIEDWHNNWMVNDDNHISNSRFFFEFEVSSSDDACESDSSGKTYTFKLEGSDKSKFELSASTGTEGNKYHVLTNNKYDYEIPNDSDGNNIYEVELQVGLAGETISKDLNLAITNIAEFGEITSFSYDEESTAFTFDFVTNHDLPIGTKQLQFAIRGPSFPSASTLLQSTVDYIEGTGTYTISIDALQALTEAEVTDKTVYGGYYEVYEIQALTETGSEIDYVRTYRIKGPRHLYYERDDGNNFVKVESIEGNIVTSDDLSHTVLTGNLKLSNFNYRPATEEAIEDFGGEPSQGTDARVTFSWHLDSGYRGLSDGWHTPSQGATYGNDLYHSEDPLDYMTTWDSEGNVSVKIYGNKKMRSGDHKYGISLGARSDRGYYRTYIYWSELVRMGLASDPISFTNTTGEPEDFYGPRLTSVTQPTVLSCEYRFASKARVQFASMMTFEDDSIDRLGNGTFKSEGSLRLRQLDEYGVQADSILLRGTPNSEGSVTLNRTDSNILIAADGPESQFILTPGELKIEDASGISSKYTDQYYDTQAGRYNDIADLNLEDIDLREHCNFNFGDNAPIFSSPSVYSVNENQSLIGTLTASDLDGDKLEYFLLLMNDYSIYSLGDSSGELRFMNPPDYEVQNSYEVVVGATDGFNYTYQTLTINIIDLDD